MVEQGNALRKICLEGSDERDWRVRSLAVNLDRYREFDVLRCTGSAHLPIGKFVGVSDEPGAPDLFYFGRIIRSPTLVIVFHGAIRNGIDTYPRFDRVGSFLKHPNAFLSFADPTLDSHSDLELAWYLGDSQWDPMSRIREVISRAVEASGARQVIFVGGSGGGFAALRISRQFPESLAFVFNPQTVLKNYKARIVEKYLHAAYGGASADEIFELEPHRFDMSRAYAGERLNYVYYLQSLGDGTHTVSHFIPFKRALGVNGVDGMTDDGRVWHVLFDSRRIGHGPPTPEEFDEHFGRATSWHESKLTDAAG